MLAILALLATAERPSWSTRVNIRQSSVHCSFSKIVIDDDNTPIDLAPFAKRGAEKAKRRRDGVRGAIDNGCFKRRRIRERLSNGFPFVALPYSYLNVSVRQTLPAEMQLVKSQPLTKDTRARAVGVHLFFDTDWLWSFDVVERTGLNFLMKSEWKVVKVVTRWRIVWIDYSIHS